MDPEKFQATELPSSEKDTADGEVLNTGKVEGGDYGLLDPARYRNRMSPELVKNKELDLSGNDLGTVREYLSNQDPAYMADLRTMISGQKTISKDVKTVIAIPSYREGENLEKTLRNYSKLKDKNQFEIVILENHPEDVERDNSGNIIEGIKKEFPDLSIIHLYKLFKEKPTIGQVRKYLVDAVLLRKSESNIEKSLAIVSSDADLEDIREDYVSRISAAFQHNKKLDAIEGKWDYPAETFKKYPLLHASQRLWRYLDIAFRNYGLKTQELTGTNSAFRSGIYAAVGGYNEKAQLAEDWEIGQLIKEARGNNQSIGRLDSAWLISNPRRAVVKMLSGGRFIEQHEDFHTNEDVRNAPLEDLLPEKRDFDEEEFTKEVQAIYKHCVGWKKSNGGSVDNEYIDRSFDRAMRFLGVKYEIEDNKIRILDMERLKKGLREYELKD
jgi:hypothetical protein